MKISVAQAARISAYDPYDEDSSSGIEGEYIRAEVVPDKWHTMEGDVTVDEVEVKKGLPEFSMMTDRQKRLWNQDLLYLDHVLHPERRTAEIIEKGAIEEVRAQVETHLITPDNITEMIGVSVKNGHTDVTAYLMQIKEDWLGELEDPFAKFSLD